MDDHLGMIHWSIRNEINIVVCFQPFRLSEVTFMIMALSLQGRKHNLKRVNVYGWPLAKKEIKPAILVFSANKR